MPAKGRRGEVGEVYVEACTKAALEPLPPAGFLDAAYRLSRECGVKTQIVGERIYLTGVRLAAAGALEKVERTCLPTGAQQPPPERETASSANGRVASRRSPGSA